MENNKKVAILMATYNGELYIREQLDSILRQSFSDYICYIRDDGSTDRTVEILKEYQSKYMDKIMLIDCHSKKKGALGNFYSIIEFVINNTKEPIIMFSDQDDIWHRDKIKIEYERIIKYYNDVPALVYTDQTIVDEKLRVLDDSGEHFGKRNEKDHDFKRIIFRNVAVGCTMCLNRKLLEVAFIDSDINSIVMHDWWVMLVAKYYGNTEFIKFPLVKYRQHSSNELGADNKRIIKKVKKYFFNFNVSIKKRRKQAELCIRQVKMLEELEDKSKMEGVVKDFLSITKKSKMYRIFEYINKGYVVKDNIFIILFI